MQPEKREKRRWRYSGGGGEKRGLLLDLRGCNGVAAGEGEKKERGPDANIYKRKREREPRVKGKKERV